MRNTLLAATAAFVIGGVTVGSLVSYAQPAPPPALGMEMDGPGGHPGGPMHWLRHGHHGRDVIAKFALVYRQSDRNLTPPDVQKIAEAFLLWRGNHTWKVVDVAPAGDGAIGFSLATQEGSVIARFSMDPHSGRLTRLG